MRKLESSTNGAKTEFARIKSDGRGGKGGFEERVGDCRFVKNGQKSIQEAARGERKRPTARWEGSRRKWERLRGAWKYGERGWAKSS